MRIILVKLYYSFDLELLNPAVDWHGQSRMHTLWKKPVLQAKVQSIIVSDS